MRHHRLLAPASLLSFALVVLLGVFALLPLGHVLVRAFWADGGFTLRAFETFFSTPYLLRSLAHSGVVSLGATALAVGLALLFAFATHRTMLPGRKVASALALLPLVSPPLVLSMALVVLLGKKGILTPALRDAFGFEDIYGPGGIILAMGLTYLPHAYLLLEAALSRQDTPVEEAAQALGARFWTVLWRITLPMARPALVRASLMVFILCMTDFGNPMMLGGDYKVAAVYLFDLIYRSIDDLPVSAAMGTIIVGPCLLAYLWAQRLARASVLTGGARGGQRGGEAIAPPLLARLGLGVLCGGTAAVIGLLYVVVLAGSVLKTIGADNTFTWMWLDPSTPGSGWELMGMTVRIALASAALGAPLALAIAYLTERVKPPGAQLLGYLALAPAALPGVIFGLGYLIAFHSGPLPLTNTPWILIVCLMMANLYVGVLAGATALQKIDPAEEEAARALGARGVQPFLQVVLPQLSTAAVSAFFFLFVRGVISLSSIVFLVSARYSVISVAILNRGEAGDYGLACAMAVQVLVVVLVAQGLLRVLEGALKPFQVPTGVYAGVARVAGWVSPWGGEAGSVGRRLRASAWSAAVVVLLMGLHQGDKAALNIVGAFDEDEFHAYVSGFKARYPDIEVKGQRLSSGQLVTRLIFEKESPGFDVVFGLIDVYMEQLLAHGVLQPYHPAEVEMIPARYRDPADHFFYVNVLLIAFGVNTEVMAQRGLPVPHTWEELADPKYRGLVSVASPAASGTALTLYSRLFDMFGPDPFPYLDRLDKNVFQYTSSGAAPAKMAAQGEAGIALTFDFPLHKRKVEGFPIEVVYPDKIPYTVEGCALLAGARHPDAARLFLDWTASKEAMQGFEARKALVTRSDVPPSEAWKKDIPMDRLHHLSRPFDANEVVRRWAERYAR